jgi:hypothetical protein
MLESLQKVKIKLDRLEIRDRIFRMLRFCPVSSVGSSAELVIQRSCVQIVHGAPRTKDDFRDLVHHYHVNRGDSGWNYCKGTWRFPQGYGWAVKGVSGSYGTGDQPGLRNSRIPVLQETARIRMKAVLTWLQEGLDPGVHVQNKKGVSIGTYNLLETTLDDVLEKHDLTRDDVEDRRW